MSAADEAVINNEDLRNFVGNQSFGNAGLAEGTNAGTIKTVNDVHYRIGNQAYVKAATDNIAVTANSAQAALTTCLYLISVNAAGTITTTKGTDDSDVIPECPSGSVPLGVLKIALANAATFTAGTTDLGATDVTDTWAHINFMPADRLGSSLTFA